MNEVSNQEVLSLMTAIRNRYDLDFTSYEMKSLKRRVSRALSMFDLTNTHELWVKVLRDKDFIHQLVNELSVGLTAMFRDPVLWRRIRELVPQIIEKNGTLKVWHAGCSSGEEVYTFNILLHELGLRKSVNSIATDMNSDALDKAEKGLYHKLKLQDYQKHFQQVYPFKQLSQYYTMDDDFGEMDKCLIDQVTFQKSNLITDNLNEEFDIIFCRNVMIYFDQIAKKKVLNKFYDNLKPNGLFIIGFFDSLITVIDKEQFEFFDLRHKIFKKNLQKRDN